MLTCLKLVPDCNAVCFDPQGHIGLQVTTKSPGLLLYMHRFSRQHSVACLQVVQKVYASRKLWSRAQVPHEPLPWCVHPDTCCTIHASDHCLQHQNMTPELHDSLHVTARKCHKSMPVTAEMHESSIRVYKVTPGTKSSTNPAVSIARLPIVGKQSRLPFSGSEISFQLLSNGT